MKQRRNSTPAPADGPMCLAPAPAPVAPASGTSGPLCEAGTPLLDAAATEQEVEGPSWFVDMWEEAEAYPAAVAPQPEAQGGGSFADDMLQRARELGQAPQGPRSPGSPIDPGIMGAATLLPRTLGLAKLADPAADFGRLGQAAKPLGFLGGVWHSYEGMRRMSDREDHHGDGALQAIQGFAGMGGAVHPLSGVASLALGVGRSGDRMLGASETIADCAGSDLAQRLVVQVDDDVHVHRLVRHARDVHLRVDAGVEAVGDVHGLVVVELVVVGRRRRGRGGSVEQRVEGARADVVQRRQVRDRRDGLGVHDAGGGPLVQPEVVVELAQRGRVRQRERVGRLVHGEGHAVPGPQRIRAGGHPALRRRVADELVQRRRADPGHRVHRGDRVQRALRQGVHEVLGRALVQRHLVVQDRQRGARVVQEVQDPDALRRAVEQRELRGLQGGLIGRRRAGAEDEGGDNNKESRGAHGAHVRPPPRDGNRLFSQPSEGRLRAAISGSS